MRTRRFYDECDVSTVTDTLAAEYARADGALRPRRPLRARQARAHRAPRRRTFLHGQVTNDIEALEPGHGLLRRLPHPQGQDARRPAGARPRRRAAARHRARRAAGALQHDPALQARPRRRAAQAHASSAGCCRCRARTRARRGRRGPRPRRARQPRAPRSAGVPVRLVATDGGRRRDLRRRARPTTVAAALRRAGAVPCRGGGRGACASSAGARATASTSTTSVIPQEAGLNERAVSFTKGCYVGQETVARLLLPRQAEPPPARAAAVGARRDGRRAAARRARGRPPRRVVVSPALGPIALALVRREAAPGDTVAVGDGGGRRSSSSLRGVTLTNRRPMAAHVLVIANVTATSPDLLAALKARAERSPTGHARDRPGRLGGGASRRREAVDGALGPIGARRRASRGGHGDASTVGDAARPRRGGAAPSGT